MHLRQVQTKPNHSSHTSIQAVPRFSQPSIHLRNSPAIHPFVCGKVQAPMMNRETPDAKECTHIGAREIEMRDREKKARRKSTNAVLLGISSPRSIYVCSQWRASLVSFFLPSSSVAQSLATNADTKPSRSPTYERPPHTYTTSSSTTTNGYVERRSGSSHSRRTQCCRSCTGILQNTSALPSLLSTFSAIFT